MMSHAKFFCVVLLLFACEALSFHVNRGVALSNRRAPHTRSEISFHRSTRIMSDALNEDGSNGLENAEINGDLNAFTDNVPYKVGQAIYVFAFLGLIDAGFSGDWVRYELIDASMEHAIKSAVYAVAAIHAASAFAAGYLANSKNMNVSVSVVAALGSGVLELMRVVGYLNETQKSLVEKSRKSREAMSVPPLQMEINSLDISSRTSPSGLLLSISILAKSGSELETRNRLLDLLNTTTENQRDLVYTMAVNQDPEDRRRFFVLQRFPSVQAMMAYQNSPAFKSYTEAAEDLLEEPMGLYLVNERSGRYSEPVYPFGPGGEGGRDDAIFSSPANLQGSQSRDRVDVMTASHRREK